MIEEREIKEIHVSCTFTYDKDTAEWLAFQWDKFRIPVKVGGPAYDDKGGEFVPGRYVKPGYVMTSRGCNNNCWFCKARKREGVLREVCINAGHNILDNNILQCSDDHIKSTFEMLKQQQENPTFTGGLEAKILKPWHVKLLKEAKTKRMYFAYDTPDDYEPLVEAGKMLQEGGFSFASHIAGCYCLIGYENDTFEKAEERLKNTLKAGFVPYAMLYKDDEGNENKEWKRFQRLWLRPTIVYMRNKELFKVGDPHGQ